MFKQKFKDFLQKHNHNIKSQEAQRIGVAAEAGVTSYINRVALNGGIVKIPFLGTMHISIKRKKYYSKTNRLYKPARPEVKEFFEKYPPTITNKGKSGFIDYRGERISVEVSNERDLTQALYHKILIIEKFNQEKFEYIPEKDMSLTLVQRYTGEIISMSLKTFTELFQLSPAAIKLRISNARKRRLRSVIVGKYLVLMKKDLSTITLEKPPVNEYLLYNGRRYNNISEINLIKILQHGRNLRRLHNLQLEENSNKSKIV